MSEGVGNPPPREVPEPVRSSKRDRRCPGFLTLCSFYNLTRHGPDPTQHFTALG